MAKSRALPIVIAFALLAASLLLSACGGEDDSSTATTTSTQAQPTATAPVGQSGGEAEEGEGDDDSSPAAGAKGAANAAPEDGKQDRPASLATDPGSIRGARVTATGAVQTLPPSESSQAEAMANSYSSIRAFGEEAEGSEATEITFALLQYLSAKASGDWATACARLYSVLRASLEQGGNGCSTAYRELMSRVSASSRAEAVEIDVASVRRGEEDRAFVIYKTPATLSADMPMYLEEGVWTVGALEAYALTPEQLEESR